MAGHVVKVSVLAETEQFKRAFRGLKSATGIDELAGAGKRAVGVLKDVAVAGGLAFGAIAVPAIKLAADLEQSTGAVEAVFKEHAQGIKDFANQAATSAGITANEYQEMATIIGSQLKNGGTSMDELAGKTDGLIRLGGDLAAQFGGSSREAVEALSSALKGERDPIERYGVTLKQAAIDAKAAEMGFADVKDEAAQQAATLQLIMDQTVDAQGAFARENETLATQLQILKANMGDLGAEFGTIFLPVLTEAAQAANTQLVPALRNLTGYLRDKIIPALQEMGQKFSEEIGPKLQELGQRFTTQVLPALQQIVDWIKTVAPPAFEQFKQFFIDWGPAILGAIAVILTFIQTVSLINTVLSIIEAAKLAFVAFNAVLAANPILLIVGAVALLVAGFIALWQHNEQFRAAVVLAWEQIQGLIDQFLVWFQSNILPGLISIWEQMKQTFQVGWEFIQTAWTTIGEPIAGFIISVFQGVMNNWDAIWSGIQNIVEGAWKIIQSVIETALGILEGIFKLGTAILKGDWEGAWEAIKDIAGTIWDGINGIIEGAMQMLGGIIETGVGVLQGLWEGAWNSIGEFVERAWDNIVNAIETGIDNAVNFITGLPDQILGAIGDLGSLLWNAGTSVIQGFIDGISSMFGSVQETLGGLTNLLPAWKGPAKKDAVILRNAGRLVIRGFNDGLKSQFGTVESTLGDLTNRVASTRFPALEAAVNDYRGHQAIGSGDVTINIEVQSLMPSEDTARKIAEALDVYYSSKGIR